MRCCGIYLWTISRECARYLSLIRVGKWQIQDCSHVSQGPVIWVNSLRPSDLTIIGSDNRLPPGRRQTIIWTNAGILLIGPLGTNFSEILAEIITFSFKKMYFKVSFAKWRPFCLGLNVKTWMNICVIISIPEVPRDDVTSYRPLSITVTSYWVQWFFKSPVSRLFTLVHERSLKSPPGGCLNKKDGLTRYGNSHVKDKTS